MRNGANEKLVRAPRGKRRVGGRAVAWWQVPPSEAPTPECEVYGGAAVSDLVGESSW